MQQMNEKTESFSTLNRTLVELKFALSGDNVSEGNALNRTLVELKSRNCTDYNTGNILLIVP